MSGPILTTASETVQRAMWDVIAVAAQIASVYQEIDASIAPQACVSLYTMQDLGLAIEALNNAVAAEGATIEAFTGVHP